MNVEFYREAAEIISVCASLAKYVGFDAEEKDFRRVYDVATPWRERILGSWLGPAEEQVEHEWTWTAREPATIMEEGLYWVRSFLGYEGWEAAERVWIYHAYPRTEEDRHTLMRVHDRAYVENETERRDSLRGRCRALAKRFHASLEALRGLGVIIDAIRAPDARAVLEAIRKATGAHVPTNKSGGRARGKNIPLDVKKTVLNFLKEEFGGDVRGEGGWETVFDRFMDSPLCSPRVRQFVTSPPSMKRIAEAARTDERRRQKK